MKLIQKLNKRYLTYSTVILIVASVSLFFVLRLIVNEEIDEKLESTCKQIELLIKKKPQTLDLYPSISVQQTDLISNNRCFSDTTLYVKDEWEKYRQLTVYNSSNGTNYKITVREFSLESNDLLKTLLFVVTACFAILLFLLYVLNKKMAIKIWSPFFGNLEKLKHFSVQSLKPFNPTQTDTDEFNEMNAVLKSLTEKMTSDYDNLKKFSENASHELQTPLAIIRSKIETLLDDKTLSTSQVDKIGTIYKNINRLSKINSGLILLTRIENYQFPQQEKISLNEVITTQIEYFSELIAMKELKFKYLFQAEKIITGNKELVDILINNLFSNAILHNIKKGEFKIELDDHFLKFSNSAEGIIPESDRLFERFYKSGTSGSTGLGLSISKQICLSMGWKISYSYIDDFHIFSVKY